MAEQSVSQIVERCQRGDREALGLLYTTMADPLRKVCHRYVADENTVNDLLHDSFILIISKIDTLKDPSKAEAWMQKVTQNLVLKYLQKRKRESAISLDDMEEPLEAASPLPMAITYDEILNLVEALPNSYRRVFRLSALEGLSHQEIAALLNIEPHTSSAQLFRAKKMLRQSLALLLLGLLCISLPLGWYWMKVNTDDEGSRLAQSTGTEIKELTPAPTIIPSQTDSLPVVNKLMVRHILAEKEDERVEVDTIEMSTKAELSVSQPEQPVLQPEQPISQPEQPSLQPEITIPARKHQQEWSVQLTYSGFNNDQSFNLPYGEYGMNDPKMDTITHHRMPLTIGLSANKMLNRQLSIGTGLQFTQLYSETQEGNTYSRVQKEQRLRYLGIPLRLSWHPVMTNHWNLYGTTQAMMELPLHSTLQRISIVGDDEIETEKLSLSPSVQWSLGVGIGLEYRLTPVIGIYVEPSLQYFFKTNDGLDSYRTKHPATISLPFGIRVTFK